MATTYTLIASSTVGSGGAANIEFTSIPSTYTDLAILTSFRDTSASTWQNFQISFNGLTSNLSSRVIYGNGGSTTSSTFASNIFMWQTSNGATASTFGNAQIYIPNYASSNNKSISADFVSENNDNTDTILGLVAGLWADSSAITTVKLTPATAFAQHSTAYLYGIKNS